MKLYLRDQVLEIREDGYYLLKSTQIAKDTTDSFQKHPFYKKYLKVIETDIDHNYKLKYDLKIKSLSEAAVIILGYPVNGRDKWKDENNKPAKEVLGFDAITTAEETPEDDLEDVEAFLKDIDILNKLDIYSQKFNVFETLNIETNEIRHSNVLGWLLNPKETHDLDDRFLKRFIRDVYIKNEETEIYNNLDLSKIFLMDFDDFEIRREYKNIDVLAYSDKQKFLLIIENKIFSNEHSNQLNRYKDIVEKEFKDYSKMYLYLTPEGESSSNGSWGTYNYSEIISILEELTELIPRENVKEFIKQYIDLVRRKIVGDTKLQELCKDIYKKHRRALDLIFDNKPDRQMEVSDYLKEIISGYDNLTYLKHTKSYVAFTTKKIYEKLKDYKNDVWIEGSSIIRFEIANEKERIRLRLVLGPYEEEIRHQILSFFENMDSKSRDFNKLRNSSGEWRSGTWTTLYSKNIHKGKEIQYENFEDTKEVINKFFKKFLEKDLIQIEEIINSLEL